MRSTTSWATAHSASSPSSPRRCVRSRRGWGWRKTQTTFTIRPEEGSEGLLGPLRVRCSCLEGSCEIQEGLTCHPGPPKVHVSVHAPCANKHSRDAVALRGHDGSRTSLASYARMPHGNGPEAPNLPQVLSAHAPCTPHSPCFRAHWN